MSVTPSLAHRLVMSSLEKMTRGGLRLTFPDGIVKLIGSASVEPQAEMTIHREAFFQQGGRGRGIGAQ